MKTIRCLALNSIIPQIDCFYPNPSTHPACKKCDNPNKRPLTQSQEQSSKKTKSQLRHEITKNDRLLMTRLFEIINRKNIPIFLRTEYPYILCGSQNIKEILERKFPEFPKREFNKILILLQERVETDIEVLKWSIERLKKEVKKRNKKPDKYHEIGTWIVESWGDQSSHILGSKWQSFKKARGRRPDLSKIREITTNYLQGEHLSKYGFDNTSKAGTFYADYKPKILINLAGVAFNILNYSDFILNDLTFKELVQEYFNLQYDKQAIQPKGIKPTRFFFESISLKKIMLEKIEQKILFALQHTDL